MSHFTVAVFMSKEDQSVDDLLAPYDENIKCAPYERYSKAELIQQKKAIHLTAAGLYVEWQQDPVTYESKHRNPAHIEYLKVVAKNATIDYIKSKGSSEKRQRRISLEDLPELTYEQDFRVFTKAEFDFEEQRLAESFAALPLLRRQVLTLTFIENLSASEIAKRLNCSTDYVYKLRQRALQKLKDLMIGDNANE